MRRVTGLLSAVAVGVACALATPAFAQASPRSICEDGQGVFLNLSPLVYACVAPEPDYADAREPAKAACRETARGGLWLDVSPATYVCLFPGSEGGLF